ncbi:MAG: T9SS type A sorting domain-containing protein [Bacteroidia bacterium]|nr:T9SS type A sorting domain-containing protein [Bacteroidia bacterium]
MIEYTFVDESISLIQNTVFYRLKQVDFDGAFEYSDIRVVRFDELGRGIHFSAYPNPTTNELSVMVSLSEGKAYQIEVTDLHGVKVHHENHTFTNGIHKLNTSEWNSGMYILQVATDKGSKYVKVMKK